MTIEQATPLRWQQYIGSDPRILGGKPAIRGTRIGVDLVLELLAGGMSIETMLSEEMYPFLSREHVLACIGYAHALLRQQIDAVNTGPHAPAG